MMNDDPAINALRAAILRFYMTDDAQQIADFLRSPHAQRHRPRLIRNIITGMGYAGLLNRWGRTSDVCYQTSRLGYVVLVTLEHEPSRAKSAGRATYHVE